MNCAQARAALAAFVYQDLPADETAAVREHLASCLACRAEETSTRRVGSLLDALPNATSQVDLAQLYKEAGRRQQVKLTRWRRFAVAASAAAAALLLALALRMELRLEGHQLLLRWGTPSIPESEGPSSGKAREPGAVNPEEVQLVHRLLQALAEDVLARDRQNQDGLVSLESRLESLEQQSRQRWDATINALYTLNTNLVRKE
jgi:hypothetical protein